MSDTYIQIVKGMAYVYETGSSEGESISTDIAVFKADTEAEAVSKVRVLGYLPNGKWNNDTLPLFEKGMK